MGVIFAVAFATALTAIIRWLQLPVREPIKYRSALALTSGFIGILILGWVLMTTGDKAEDRFLSPVILPSPMEVINAFPTLHFELGLVQGILISWWRVTQGFLLAVILAVPLGVFMGTFQPVAAFFRPLALIGGYVPIVCFLPLTLAWWGLAESQKVGFLTIGCFVALLPMVIKVVADVPAALLDVTVTKGATNWQLIRHVIFPAALPNIWDHMRGVYGVGWGYIVLAELVSSESGLGHIIYISERRTHPEWMYATIIVIVAIAVACDKLWAFGGRKLFPGRPVHD